MYVMDIGGTFCVAKLSESGDSAGRYFLEKKPSTPGAGASGRLDVGAELTDL